MGLAGYGCLATLSAGSGLAGVSLIVLGIGAYVGAAGQRLDSAAEAPALADALERAVILCGFGSLGLLVAVVAAVVLLKELSDDAARAARGPLRQESGE